MSSKNKSDEKIKFNFLDIKMNIIGAINKDNLTFSTTMVTPTKPEERILFTPLFKYTEEALKEAKIPYKHTSFYEKSPYLFKFIRYSANKAIENKERVPKYGSKIAGEIAIHNINFMLKRIFKPKELIYIENNAFTIYKIDKTTNTNDWITMDDAKKIRKDKAIQVNIVLETTERGKSLNEFAILDCKDKRNEIGTDLLKFMGYDKPKKRDIINRRRQLLAPAYSSTSTGYVADKVQAYRDKNKKHKVDSRYYRHHSKPERGFGMRDMNYSDNIRSTRHGGGRKKNTRRKRHKYVKKYKASRRYK